MLHVIINQAVGLQVDGTDTVDHGFFAVLHAKHLDGRPLNELQAGGANHEAGNGSGGGPGSGANMIAFTDLANLLKDRAITQQEYAALLVGHCWLLAGFARTHVTPPTPPLSRADPAHRERGDGVQGSRGKTACCRDTGGDARRR
jgi:hypothetical protein